MSNEIKSECVISNEMAEEKPRTLKVLEALSKVTEPSGPADIGIIIEVSLRDTGKTLYDLGKAGLARKPDEKQSQWLITDKGQEYIQNPPVPSAGPSARPSAEEITETVPSQSDLFRFIGERLRISVGKGGERKGRERGRERERRERKETGEGRERCAS